MLKSFSELSQLPVSLRKLIRISVDLLAIIFALFSIGWITEKALDLDLMIFSCLTGPLIFALFRLYGSLTKYIGIRSTYKLILSNLFFTNLIFIYQYIFTNVVFSANNLFGLFICLTAYTALSRILLKQILITKNISIPEKSQKIVIYGAGSSGAQIEASLGLDKNYKIKFFVDDSPLLWGRNINGIVINSPKSLITNKSEIDRVIITQENISRKRIREIINNLNYLNLKFMVIPSIKNLIDGKINFDILKKVEIEDLLGRDIVEPNKELMSRSITGSVVCITGAGGSIGSELCKQIIQYEPKKIILLDSNEFNLYTIDLNLKELAHKNLSIEVVLGSVNDNLLLEKIFKNNEIDIVFHAAAYKHVPLIENNPLEGIKNNIFSSKNLCELSLKYQVKKVILISSDKAVRPTNIMGATKRASELIFLSYANISREESKTCFSAVRFGNVLGSSGSVVPLFKKQISKGGPITITHPDIIRYFMTIKEASQLVVQASSMAKNGEIFLLDMGQPVKIIDLANQMVQLSGLSVKDQNQNGDIEIKITGIRAGEKLYEELLIDGKSKKTEHPLIFKADEKKIKSAKLNSILKDLEKNANLANVKKALDNLHELVPEWKINKRID